MVTIAPAATIDPSPISMFDKNVEFAPIEAPFLITGPLKIKVNSYGILIICKTGTRPYKYIIFYNCVCWNINVGLYTHVVTYCGVSFDHSISTD